LLLDEPTNHLDLQMRHALSVALQGFAGAMVIVSHDRHLLKTVTDELVIVHDGKAEVFEGDLDDYAKYIAEFNLKEAKINVESKAENSETINLSKKEQRQQEAVRRKQLQPLRNKLKNLEKELDQLTEKQAKLELILADPDSYLEENKDQLKKNLLNKSEIDKALAKVESEWMELSEEYEQSLSKS